MKRVRIVSVLIFSMAFIASVLAQSILEQHFGGNRDSFIAEATRLIEMDEPTFDSVIETMPMN